eukprot:scaffold117559_cov15-Tisochrysis_lutea.AAC.1
MLSVPLLPLQVQNNLQDNDCSGWFRADSSIGRTLLCRNGSFHCTFQLAFCYYECSTAASTGTMPAAKQPQLEFFALLSFVAPDLLGNSQTFKRVRELLSRWHSHLHTHMRVCVRAHVRTLVCKLTFADGCQALLLTSSSSKVYSDPIAKSHDRTATKEEEEIGKARERLVLQNKFASAISNERRMSSAYIAFN